MKNTIILIFVMVFLSAVGMSPVYSAEQVNTPVLTYKPPTRGAPASRIGGGSRGISDDIPDLVVLAPDHTGLTIKAQPVVYWYLSRPMETRIELTVVNDDAIDPLFEEKIKSKGQGGIYSFNFSKHNIMLQPGTEYRWFVALSLDSDSRSSDIVAGGTIQRSAFSREIQNRLNKVSQSEQLNILASEGIWYDTIDLISQMIEKNPADQSLINQRNRLLNQVGLTNIGG